MYGYLWCPWLSTPCPEPVMPGDRELGTGSQDLFVLSQQGYASSELVLLRPTDFKKLLY